MIYWLQAVFILVKSVAGLHENLSATAAQAFWNQWTVFQGQHVQSCCCTEWAKAHWVRGSRGRRQLQREAHCQLEGPAC